MNKDEALNIAADFQNYLRGGDKSFIEKYTIKDIKCALSLISHGDNNKQWYKEMERRIVELETATKEHSWHKNYFWDKIFPIVLTVVLTAIASFTVAYSLKALEVKKLKASVQALESRESTVQSEIKKAVASGDPSELIAVFNKINRLSSMSREDKRQLRNLEAEEDTLLEKLRLAVGKSDGMSISIIERDIMKVREKIRRLKE